MTYAEAPTLALAVASLSMLPLRRRGSVASKSEPLPPDGRFSSPRLLVLTGDAYRAYDCAEWVLRVQSVWEAEWESGNLVPGA